MVQMPTRLSAWIPIAVPLPLFIAAGLVGGANNHLDVAAILALAEVRSATPGLTELAVFLTHFGGSPALVAILLAALAVMASARRWRDVTTLAAIVLGGRIMVELFKIVINRPRPNLTPFPVDVFSLSFPSGHAANTMITFLALALIAAPPKYRTASIAAAIAASIVIGLTRPLLGVHWPSDVIGGWSFGIAWVLAGVALSYRWRTAAK
jgi:undecaprenyl-diphosphatase